VEWLQVDAHIIVSKQRFSYLALGTCPTQSTISYRKTLQKRVLVEVELHEYFDSVFP
jgi:hypothetical protein